MSFSLRINDDKKALSKERGISINELSDLLSDLYSALDIDLGANITLSEVTGSSYALKFNTDEPSYEERFKEVHKNIEQIPIE